MSWHSYPKVYALGHKAIADLLLDPVVVEEKIDGSQFSFGKFIVEEEQDLLVRSKGVIMNILAPEKMFAKACETVLSIGPSLHPGWTYRTEFLQKPKHNALAYDRVPRGYLILFDINTDNETYLSWEAKAQEAERLGLEIVPRLYEGFLRDAVCLKALLETPSILGGQKIEGVVVKNYHRFGVDRKVLMGKFVSEEFKEVHAKEWKKGNPSSEDAIKKIINRYATPARWAKALQHLREKGRIEDSPRDIGPLIAEVWPDILAECGEEMKGELWAWAEGKIRRGLTRGLPEWYKQLLMEKQFEGEI